jgi:hypothetical protein
MRTSQAPCVLFAKSVSFVVSVHSSCGFINCIIFVHADILGVSRVAHSVQCLTTGWKAVRLRFDSRQRQRIFPLASVSRPALGPTQPPVQWVPGGGVLSTVLKRGRGVTLTTHPHVVPRSRMSRSYTFSPPKRLRGV